MKQVQVPLMVVISTPKGVSEEFAAYDLLVKVCQLLAQEKGVSFDRCRIGETWVIFPRGMVVCRRKDGKICIFPAGTLEAEEKRHAFTPRRVTPRRVREQEARELVRRALARRAERRDPKRSLPAITSVRIVSLESLPRGRIMRVHG